MNCWRRKETTPHNISLYSIRLGKNKDLILILFSSVVIDEFALIESSRTPPHQLFTFPVNPSLSLDKTTTTQLWTISMSILPIQSSPAVLQMACQTMAQVCSQSREACTLLIVIGVVQLDPWLEPFKGALRERYSKAQEWIKTIDETEGGLEKFSRVRGSYSFLEPRLTGPGN